MIEKEKSIRLSGFTKFMKIQEEFHMKKTLAILLSAMMCASLMSACGGSNGSSSSESKAEESSAASDSVSESAEGGDSTAADGALTGTLKLGHIGPLTGGAAVYGISTSGGAKIAVDEINAANTHGFTIELNNQDDEHDAE